MGSFIHDEEHDEFGAGADGVFELGGHLGEGAGGDLVFVLAELQFAFAADDVDRRREWSGVGGESPAGGEGELDDFGLIVVMKGAAIAVDVGNECVWGGGCHSAARTAFDTGSMMGFRETLAGSEVRRTKVESFAVSAQQQVPVEPPWPKPAAFIAHPIP